MDQINQFIRIKDGEKKQRNEDQINRCKVKEWLEQGYSWHEISDTNERFLSEAQLAATIRVQLGLIFISRNTCTYFGRALIELPVDML